MCLTGTLLRSVLVVLLLTNTCGKRRCNFKEILDSYRVVILVELQNLARRILVSIYGMTQQIRCQRGGRLQFDLEKPVESMEQLIIHKCSPDYLGKRNSCSAVKKIRGKKRKRNRVIKVIKTLITCWQKLQSIYMLSK
ncbi:Hypothetical protein SMAX5B_014486 [Scophthalmus maximus]|uniref:Secreted protein n=1 Tax=Scophthalmus maximus TaxID=52904 RepID=A0A2U9BZM2_SCOMX|nr:Hypothetical protein SMAX5B_014486 [Scophthalmus maximus]